MNFLRQRRGFTLIELMIVVSIIGILASIAVPNYQSGVIRAREAVLSDTLSAMRKAIDEYYADQGKYPDTLDGLVARRYLRELPMDPFTKKRDSWVTVAPPAETASAGAAGEQSAPEKEPGNVYDVHSGSTRVGSNGMPYNEW